MFFNKIDICKLLEYGYTMEDIEQIKSAKKIVKITSEKGERITQKKAVELLGREKFLSGLGRATFHWTSARETQDGKEIFFDCSNLFKD